MMRQAMLTLRSLLSLATVLCVTNGFNINIDLSVTQKGPEGSNFGFDLDTLRDNTNHVRIIVGAPRHTSTFTSVISSGALFDCSFDNSSECKELDMGVGDGVNTLSIQDQLLGFSLDTGYPELTPPKITACAPMWKNVRVKGVYLVQGQCYEIGYGEKPTFQQTYEPMKRLGLTALDDKLFTKDDYVKGMGESGFTVHYKKPVKGKSSLVVGAPGYHQWRGGIVDIDNTTQLTYSRSMLAKSYEEDSYASYSMTSGQFFSDAKVYLVTGSPNWRYKGKILVFLETLERIQMERQGSQIGGYYGAAVCCVDVNNDNVDDLLVGAPLFSTSTFEEGKVFVYESNGLDEKAPLEGPGVTGGRFGTAIANAGDLNGDGYNDVIVGAPFVTVSGAIYIYQGSAAGLKTKPSQVILGKSIDPNLKGFGWSFSKSADTDNNGYPDIAVGAPFSNHVTSLFTVPVVSVKARLTIQHGIINTTPRCLYQKRKHMCTQVTVTFTYTGKNCPNELKTNFELRADTLADEKWELGRAQFQISKTVLSPSIHRNITLKHGQTTRFNYLVIIQPRIDRYTDIGFEFRFNEVIECKQSPLLCPVPDVHSPHEIHKQITFPKSCGPDDVCVADLSLQADIPDSLLIGSPYIRVEVNLTNNGEPAYLPTVKFEYNKLFTVHSVVEGKNPDGSSVFCELSPSSRQGSGDDGNTTLICYTGYVLMPTRRSHFFVTFDVSEVKATGNTTAVAMTALTLSDELNSTLDDNVVSKKMALKMEARLDTKGASVPEQIRYRLGEKAKEDDAESNHIQLTHQYTVSNIGEGRTSGIAVTVRVPARDSQGRQLLHITSVTATPVEGQRGDVSATCEFEGRTQTAESSLGTNKPTQKQMSSDNTVYLTCEKSSCVTAKCIIYELKPGKAAIISINGWIPETFFSKHESNGKFKLQTSATVRVLKHVLIVPGSFEQGSYTVTTEIYGPLSTPLSTWILIACAVICLVILGITVLVFWKLGFFKRKYREDLRQLMSDENSSHEMGSVNSREPSFTERNELPPRCQPEGAIGGADYVIPVSKNADDFKDDPYLHPVSVALPPIDDRNSNIYVSTPERKTPWKEDERAALVGTRL